MQIALSVHDLHTQAVCSAAGNSGGNVDVVSRAVTMFLEVHETQDLCGYKDNYAFTFNTLFIKIFAICIFLCEQGNVNFTPGTWLW